MKLERARELGEILEKDKQIQNLIDRNNSRFILYSVDEPLENFPNFNLNDTRIRLLAFEYLNVGCTYAENDIEDLSILFLNKGAQIIEHVDFKNSDSIEESTYYILISSLAYYSAFHYSKAYILINKIQYKTPISRMVSFFLGRNFSDLRVEINNILLSENFNELTMFDENEELSQAYIYYKVYARVFNLWLNHIQFGTNDLIEQIDYQLERILELAQINNRPDIWWLTRLLRICFKGYNQSNLWNFILPLIASSDSNDDFPVRYIRSLTLRDSRPITELFTSQRAVIPKALDNNSGGEVISLPTSSGKTRVAEITILQHLIDFPDSKVIYIAPFRALAFEIEDTLNNTFGPLDIEISHMYGGNRVSSTDNALFDEARVLILTPEKAKALLRSNRDLFSELSLMIVDEGHLVGAGQKRLVFNELFLEEVRAYKEKHHLKILVLSAVLPNVEDLAQWITGNKSNNSVNLWKPSSERFGIARWTGNELDLEWINNSPDTPPFNRKFITKKDKYPKEYKQAISLAALKLSKYGSVLIFVTIKKSVFTYAKEVLKAMDENPQDFKIQNDTLWEHFKLACIEVYGEDSIWYNYASKGIICHNASLPSIVRIPLESIIQKENPPIIISTSTLGQGVNLGISSVIFAQIYQSGKPISHREFWNIAGRAGRAYTDTEGKVLVGVNEQVKSNEKYKIRYRRDLAKSYFNRDSIEFTYSGILQIFINLIELANSNEIDNELLIELIANNYSSINQNDYSEVILDIETNLDIIDDTLIALNLEFDAQTLESPHDWIDNFFRGSLASIQEKTSDLITTNDVIDFLKARNRKIITETDCNPLIWKSISSSGINYDSAKKLRTNKQVFIDLRTRYNNSEKNIEDKLNFVLGIDSVVNSLSIIQSDSKLVAFLKIDNLLRDVLQPWLKGESIISINKEIEKAYILERYLTFTLPWAISAISKMLKQDNNIEEAEDYELIAILVEMGLPNYNATMVFLSGIKSRLASVELSDLLLEDDFSSYKNLRKVICTSDFVYIISSESTKHWITLYKHVFNFNKPKLTSLNSFTFTNDKLNDANIGRLYVRRFQDRIYLCTEDYNEKVDVTENKLNFKSISDINGIHFEYNFGAWNFKSINPHYVIR